MSKTAEYQFYAPAGRPTLNVYQEVIKGNRKTLEKTGETNVYERIQLDLEQSKIENILHAVAMGDLSVLNQREGTYIDTSNYPKDLMTMMNMTLKAKQEFETYPTEVKELFHNSAEEYISTMGSKEFLDKMAPYNEKIKAIKEAGSVKEYEAKVATQAKFEKDVEKAKGAEQ